MFKIERTYNKNIPIKGHNTDRFQEHLGKNISSPKEPEKKEQIIPNKNGVPSVFYFPRTKVERKKENVLSMSLSKPWRHSFQITVRSLSGINPSVSIYFWILCLSLRPSCHRTRWDVNPSKGASIPAPVSGRRFADPLFLWFIKDQSPLLCYGYLGLLASLAETIGCSQSGRSDGICRSACLSVCVPALPVYLSMSMPLCLSLWLSVCLPGYSDKFVWSVWLFVCLFVSLPILPAYLTSVFVCLLVCFSCLSG